MSDQLITEIEELIAKANVDIALYDARQNERTAQARELIVSIEGDLEQLKEHIRQLIVS